MEPEPLLKYRYSYDSVDLSVINELTKSDFDYLRAKLASEDEIYNELITTFGEKTFCVQQDIERGYTNEIWNELFLSYRNAERRIQGDWGERQRFGFYMHDKSYILIYKFNSLPNFTSYSRARYLSTIQNIIQ